MHFTHYWFPMFVLLVWFFTWTMCGLPLCHPTVESGCDKTGARPFSCWTSQMCTSILLQSLVYIRSFSSREQPFSFSRSLSLCLYLYLSVRGVHYAREQQQPRRSLRSLPQTVVSIPHHTAAQLPIGFRSSAFIRCQPNNKLPLNLFDGPCWRILALSNCSHTLSNLSIKYETQHFTNERNYYWYCFCDCWITVYDWRQRICLLPASWMIAEPYYSTSYALTRVLIPYHPPVCMDAQGTAFSRTS